MCPLGRGSSAQDSGYKKRAYQRAFRHVVSLRMEPLLPWTRGDFLLPQDQACSTGPAIQGHLPAHWPPASCPPFSAGPPLPTDPETTEFVPLSALFSAWNSPRLSGEAPGILPDSFQEPPPESRQLLSFPNYSAAPGTSRRVCLLHLTVSPGRAQAPSHSPWALST